MSVSMGDVAAKLEKNIQRREERKINFQLIFLCENFQIDSYLHTTAHPHAEDLIRL